jgi:hypothetical protein
MENLAKGSGEVDGQHHITLSELFHPQFISSCSRFHTVSDLFEANGFKIENQEDFNKIPIDEWNSFIRDNTKFEDWGSMKKAAAGQWAKRKLGL